MRCLVSSPARRPEFNPALFVTQLVVGGILVSAVHWTALARWRDLRRLVFREEAYES
jgi:hypothetical protein